MGFVLKRWVTPEIGKGDVNVKGYPQEEDTVGTDSGKPGVTNMLLHMLY